MNTGKTAHLNRLFSHPSGAMCSIAVDHFPIYNMGLPQGLRQIQSTLAAIAEGQPDAVTIFKGLAMSAWKPYAGRIPLILQSSFIRPDGSTPYLAANVEEAVRLAADAVAVVAFVYGPGEATALNLVSNVVREAERFDLPVICHTYPRDLSTPNAISHRPEDVAWAVRCAVEMGVDVVKAPYCGDQAAYADIVNDCPVPMVAAGGPKTDTVLAALEIVASVRAGGGRGATVGRNVWGNPGQITQLVKAYKAVIHDGTPPREALASVGL